MKKAPPLPPKWKEVFIKIMPWAVVLMLLAALPAITALLGFSAIALPFTSYYHQMGTIRVAVSFAQIILYGLAVKPLFAKKIHGWNFVFYAGLLAMIDSLVYFSFTGLVLALLGIYVLYQIKESYTA